MLAEIFMLRLEEAARAAKEAAPHRPDVRGSTMPDDTRASIISGPVSRSATAFYFCILGQIRLTRHLVIGCQVRRWWPTGGRVASYGTPAAFE